MAKKLPRVDLNLFIVFDAIYREGNLTRASQKLNLSQPAVSHALSRLRENFDDPLFERSGKGVAPTPLAKAIVGRVRAALAEFESALSEGLAFDPAKSEREFTFACRDVLEATALSSLMRILQNEAPGVSVRSVRLPRKELESALASGRVDLAADVILPFSKDVKHQALVAESMVVAMRRDHPLADKPWNLDAYLSADHVLVSSRAEGPGMEDYALSRIGRHRQIRLRCQNYYSAIHVIANTDLLVTLPATYAQQLEASIGYYVRPLPLHMDALEVHVYWHAKAESDPAVMWLRDQMASVYSR
jgi:DNA-binding transcriptional LysR family regulator